VSAREAFRSYWAGPGGGGEVLRLAYPLILSNMSFTVQTFVDRLFLTWYSAEALAGAVTSLFSVWVLMGLFIGTGEYLTAFVAQYHGARRDRRIGAALWQGFYFSLGAGLLVAALSPLAGPVFELAGHAPEIRAHETAYARILMLGAFPVVLMATLSTFFAGRGQTRVILLVNILATVVNLVLDYLWIFGHGGFPRMGVEGAALSTIVSQAVGALVYAVLILCRSHRESYATAAAWRPEAALLGRLLRYGLPAGLQVSLEILAFAIFMMIVGRLGTEPLAASGLAFNLNMIVFFPMIGLGIGVSSLVGRYLGADQPELAERSTWSAFWMSLAYMVLCGAAYVLLPRLLLAPYAAGADPAAFAAIEPITVVLLRYVAVYSIFDMMNVIFAAGLKGAGDTAYPLRLTIALSWGAMLLPAYVLCVRLGAGVYVGWTAASAYVVLLGLLMLRRFRAGRWRALRVIESGPDPALEPAVAEARP
jgi:MATE family multidrug resistance protein